MAFFKKLKDRLFRSSSKIEEGLDAIVEDGGVEETAMPEPELAVVEPVPVPDLAPDPEPELASEPEQVPASQPESESASEP